MTTHEERVRRAAEFRPYEIVYTTSITEGVTGDGPIIFECGRPLTIYKIDSMLGWLKCTAKGVMKTFTIDPTLVSHYPPEPETEPPTPNDEEQQKDLVNHPSHYARYDPETIDLIANRLNKPAFEGFLRGTIYRYLDRYPHKGTPITDLKKARFYLDRLIAELEDPT